MFLETKREGEAKTADLWRDLLLRAADAIEKFGHAKNALCEPSGAMCAIGALNFADRGSAVTGQDSSANLSAWTHLCRAVGGSVVEWNNAPGRTAAEVVATMRAAAAS